MEFISELEVSQLRRYCEVLKGIEKFTLDMQSDSFVTMSLVLQCIYDLVIKDLVPSVEDDTPILCRFKSTLLATVKEHFDHILSSITLASIAAALNPRTGNLPMLSLEMRNQVWKCVTEEAVALLTRNPLKGDSTLTLSAEAIPGLIQSIHKRFEDDRYQVSLSQVEPLS